MKCGIYFKLLLNVTLSLDYILHEKKCSDVTLGPLLRKDSESLYRIRLLATAHPF